MWEEKYTFKGSDVEETMKYCGGFAIVYETESR